MPILCVQVFTYHLPGATNTVSLGKSWGSDRKLLLRQHLLLWPSYCIAEPVVSDGVCAWNIH